MPVKPKQNILFVSHKANLSGAPVLLLELIKEFRDRSDIPFKILVIEDGELTKDFSHLGKTYVWKKKTGKEKSIFPGFIERIFLRMSHLLNVIFILTGVRKSTLVFFNTITNGHIYKKLLFLKCPFVCYVHEMEAAIQMLTNKETLNLVLKRTDLFLTGSRAVMNNMVSNHNINSGKIKVAHYVMQNCKRDKASFTDFRSAFKKKYFITDDVVIIGVAASAEWRKGFDLFIPLVTIYEYLFPEDKVCFVWKGFNPGGYTADLDLFDLKKNTKIRNVLILPHGNDNIDTISCFEIHLLLSREDPYPLVVLEAASFGIPTVCFLDSGGSPEFIEEDAGFCVPYGDLISMCKKLNELVQNPGLREAKGRTANEKLQTKHSPQKTMRQFMEILDH